MQDLLGVDFEAAFLARERRIDDLQLRGRTLSSLESSRIGIRRLHLLKSKSHWRSFVHLRSRRHLRLRRAQRDLRLLRPLKIVLCLALWQPQRIARLPLQPLQATIGLNLILLLRRGELLLLERQLCDRVLLGYSIALRHCGLSK